MVIIFIFVIKNANKRREKIMLENKLGINNEIELAKEEERI